ncbi:MAG: fluoride efflux transporter CrcB [Methylococcaceae bacterium]
MNQLIAIALGCSCGAIMRSLVSTSTYQWSGKRFPYGALTVNVVGSFLVGLLTEALLLNRIALTLEYRAAILVGSMGAFTTFSTFSLETLYLIDQGNLTKATVNIVASLSGCLFATWIGLLRRRSLFIYSDGVIYWAGATIPYVSMTINATGGFLIGVIVSILLQKVALSDEPLKVEKAIQTLKCRLDLKHIAAGRQPLTERRSYF